MLGGSSRGVGNGFDLGLLIRDLGTIISADQKNSYLRAIFWAREFQKTPEMADLLSSKCKYCPFTPPLRHTFSINRAVDRPVAIRYRPGSGS